MNYSNLDGWVVNEDIDIKVVSIIGDRMFDDVSVPGCDVWFLGMFWYRTPDFIYGRPGCYLRCLTQDCVNFHPFTWFDGLDTGSHILKSDQGSASGGPIWWIVGSAIRDFASGIGLL